MAVEGLESRLLFHVVVTTPIADVSVPVNAPAGSINLNSSFDNDELTGTIVRLATNVGNIDLEMFDVAVPGRSAAPLSVANFLNYVNNGTYNNTIFHRSAQLPGGIPFVLQGGGFRTDKTDISPPGTPTVPNEFSPDRSNVRGTIAYAKTALDPNVPGSGPDSATTEFFFNLGDNSGGGPSLDTQNGGFTVFGQVLNMSVVDAIAALPTVNAFDPADPTTGAFSNLPVRNPAPAGVFPPADNLVVINSASVIPEITYEVVNNTNLSAVLPTIQNNTLTLEYPPGGTGSSNVTIRATDVLGNTAEDTFAVNVLSGNEQSITVGDTGAKSLTFTDADGTDVTITYKGGNANVVLTGSGLAQQESGKGTVVTGVGVDLSSIAITGATRGGALTIKGKGGDGRVRLGSITSDGSLKSISAKEVTLTNGMTINGSAAKVDLLRAEGGTISMTGNGPVSLTADTLVDTDVNVAGPIKSLKLAAYNKSAGSFHGIDAGSIGKLTVSGDYQGNLTSRAGFGGAKVGGGVGGGAWNVGAGKIGKISAGSVAPDWSGSFSGALPGFNSAGDMGGALTAGAVKSLTVKGALQNATFFLNDPSAGPTGVVLGKLTVGGAIANSTIRTSNSLGTITADSLDTTKIYAGVNPAPAEFEPSVPVDLTFFVNNASSIKGVTLKRKDPNSAAFTASNVAAPVLGKLALGNINPATPNILYGVAADRIDSLTGALPSGAGPFKLTKLDDPAAAAPQIQALGTLGNFVIRVF